ncbi:hypothetical protein [Dactylosporangium sp. NPDC000521]|uniref:hypothetical protein n=1 Tax=Dactylosporangium sp. NPDC000521 TaxID=3363975 RepID=UPI0036839474
MPGRISYRGQARIDRTGLPLAAAAVERGVGGEALLQVGAVRVEQRRAEVGRRAVLGGEAGG